MASSRTLIDSVDGAKLWRVDLGGGFNQTFLVDCPHFEHSRAFASEADATAYLQDYGARQRGLVVEPPPEPGPAHL